jgi:hypothetical protein
MGGRDNAKWMNGELLAFAFIACGIWEWGLWVFGVDESYCVLSCFLVERMRRG